MPVHFARAAAISVGRGGAGPSAVVLLLLSLGGCAAPPPAASLAAAADPRALVPAARYSSVTAPYTPQRPVEPQPWLERNQRVAPQPSQ
jgi:hypothetical protein